MLMNFTDKFSTILDIKLFLIPMILAIIANGFLVEIIHADDKDQPNSDSSAITATPEQQETMSHAISNPKSNLPYLFAAFALTWVIFFAYIYVISTRQRYLQQEIETLRKILADENATK